MKALFVLFGRRPQQQQFKAILESLALADAYACVNCRKVVEGVDNSRCKLCGSYEVFSVVKMLDWIEKETAMRRMKDKKKPVEGNLQAIRRNEALFLTAREAVGTGTTSL